MIIHFLGFFVPSTGRAGPAVPCSCCFVCRSKRTSVVNRRSTFIAVFADVSRNSHPKFRANCAPSSLDTSRSYCLSHLLPTSIKTGFCRFTFIIACRKTSNRSKVAREAMEYTRMKPCPSLYERSKDGVSGVRHGAMTESRIRTGPIDPAMSRTPLYIMFRVR